MGACVLLAAIQGIPATAEITYEQPTAVRGQSFTAPVSASTPVVRDTFNTSMYSTVQWPVPSTTRISSFFGYRNCRGCTSDHKGIDFVPGAGAGIQSIADGVVREVSTDGILGVNVIVDHVIFGKPVSSLYAHMQFGSPTVVAGQKVERGQLLGKVGDTGLSTGAHLHFGILINEIHVDPYTWLRANVNS